MHKFFQILFLGMILSLPALVSANSLESYDFDDTFFSGSYSPEYYVESELHFAWNTNDFWWKIFFQDLKTIPLTQLDMDGGGQLYCTKQVRWFYINTARGNRVRPLDEDSLAYLQSVDSSYNNLIMTWWLYICGLVDNGVYGYIKHTWSWEEYTLIAWADYDFGHNRFITGDRSYPATFLFENMMSIWYLWDSYWWIAQLSGAGLDVIFACGDWTINSWEICDDGDHNWQLNYCNLTCNGQTTSTCDNALIESWEICDEWTLLNGQVGHCNHACSAIVSQPSNGWWDWGGWISTDIKQWLCEVRDCSDSYYDGTCGICTPDDKELHNAAWPQDFLINNPALFAIEVAELHGLLWSRYSLEFMQAYVFAKDIGITTMVNIDQAHMTWTLLRSHMAKMLVNYAVKIMNQKPDLTRQCVFSDMQNSSVEMQWYSRLACQLGLMWLKKDGTPDTKFTPDGIVTRAQFGTVLSRLLYGNTYNNQPWLRYAAHLNALKTANIMTKISIPTMDELRGYVMIMLMRVSQKQ